MVRGAVVVEVVVEGRVVRGVSYRSEYIVNTTLTLMLEN